MPTHTPASDPEARVSVRHLPDLLAGALIMQGRGDLPGGLAAVEKLLRTAEQEGVQTATVRTARRIQAELLFELGETDRAHRLATDLYEQCVAALPPRHPATLRVAVLLAGIRHHLGDLDTAAELCQRAMGAGGDQPDGGAGGTAHRPAGRAILLAHAHLALITADRGDLPAAIDLLDQAAQRLRDAYGDGDPDTLRVTAQLAELHVTAGQRDQARRLLTHAHHAARVHHGPTHPTTARLDRLLSTVEPPLPTADTEPAAPAGQHTGRRTSSSSATGATRRRDSSSSTVEAPDLRRPRHTDKQPTWIRVTAWRPVLVRWWGARRPTRHRLVQAAVSVLLLAGLAALGGGVATLHRPAPADGRLVESAAPRPSEVVAPVVTDLMIARTASRIVVTWVNPGAATPVLTLTFAGHTVATVTLPAGSTRYQSTHLDPDRVDCVSVALFPPGVDTAVGRQACLPAPGGS